ncbi:MAG TPA: P1 family peptidase [Methylovirgula sp.]|nr:P1 family peptidase [Methylovirgula sp.]
MSSQGLPGLNNLITDIPGIRIGHAEDVRIGSGATALLFDRPATASVAIRGCAPGLRDGALLEPDSAIEKIDALVLSGGALYGLDAAGGTSAFLREQGRALLPDRNHVPIVPGAVIFDLQNGGDKNWGNSPVYWYLGYAAAAAAKTEFPLGNVGVGLGATLADLKGGLGSASTRASCGFYVGALVAVDAAGQATIGDGPHFWAAPYERNGEFGGRGWPQCWPNDVLRVKANAAQNATIAVIATDAALTKAEAKRLAGMAQDGMARALRPAHAALNGDIVFSVATGTALEPPSLGDLTEIGNCAADCVARAIARAVFEAEALPFESALPSWKVKFG